MTTTIAAHLADPASQFATRSDGAISEGFTATMAGYTFDYQGADGSEKATFRLERAAPTSLSIGVTTLTPLADSTESVSLEMVLQDNTIECKSKKELAGPQGHTNDENDTGKIAFSSSYQHQVGTISILLSRVDSGRLTLEVIWQRNSGKSVCVWNADGDACNVAIERS